MRLASTRLHRPDVHTGRQRCRQASLGVPGPCELHAATQPHRQQGGTHAVARRQLVIAAAASLPQKSFDDDEQLDSDLADELSRFKSREAWAQMAEHLDLVWKIGRNRGRRSPCSCCSGTGQTECRWCHGTGAMMIGDKLFQSSSGGSHCPVCHGKGELPCENCRGTGYRAGWMQGPEECRT